MSDTNQPIGNTGEEVAAEQAAEPKKTSLAEAVKKKLEEKKAAQAKANAEKKHGNNHSNQVMRNQNNRKSTNFQRKMGGGWFSREWPYDAGRCRTNAKCNNARATLRAYGAGAAELSLLSLFG